MQDIFIIHSFGEGLLGWPRYLAVVINSAAVHTVSALSMGSHLAGLVTVHLELGG